MSNWHTAFLFKIKKAVLIIFSLQDAWLDSVQVDERYVGKPLWQVLMKMMIKMIVVTVQMVFVDLNLEQKEQIQRFFYEI